MNWYGEKTFDMNQNNVLTIDTNAPEFNELLTYKNILVSLYIVLARAQMIKPNDRGKKDRYIAMFISDLEKLIAFYRVYIDTE